MSLGAGSNVDGGSNGAGAGSGASGGSVGQGSGTGAGAGNSPGGVASGGNTGATGGGTGQTGAAGGAASGGQGGLGDGGKGGNVSWRDSLPEEMRSDPTLNKYSDLPNLARAHIELQKKIGEKGIFKPRDGASKEEVAAFREALGIPTDATKYNMGDFDKSVKVDPAIVDWAKKLGAENGIDPAAMKNVITDYMKLDAQNQSNALTKRTADMKKDFEGLRSEWGDAFDRNLNRANFAAEKLGGKGLVERMQKLGIDNDIVLIKAFAEAAKLYGEDHLREAGAGAGGDSPQELESEIASVQAQMMSAKSGTPVHKALVDKYAALYRRKTGGK